MEKIGINQGIVNNFEVFTFYAGHILIMHLIESHQASRGELFFPLG